jgi:CheY-like chemotaxis protein
MQNHQVEGRPIVLVVEDEPILMMDVVDMLEDEGFDVIEATNAAEAVKILETRTDVSATVTDIEMPGSMDGLMLAKLIRKRWPPIAIIVTSGRVKVEDGDLPEGSVFYTKPFRTGQIAGKLRNMIVA